jgi:hypothetical protein
MDGANAYLIVLCRGCPLLTLKRMTLFELLSVLCAANENK